MGREDRDELEPSIGSGETGAEGAPVDAGSVDALLREVARLDDADPPLDALSPGSRLGPFEVLSELGRGGMGVVYLADDTRLRRQVALKVLPSALASDDERRRRLLREARAAAAVTHPNIAGVHEVGEADGRVFVAMERVVGESLRARLAPGPLAVEQAVEIGIQVLRGLGAAHSGGLVHRDLKPDNIMIGAEGLVKILDFGVAKRTEDASTPVGVGATTSLATSAGRLVGTPAYMSPEQSVGGAVDARSDLFSFGVTLYEMLVGRRPFVGETTAELLRKVLGAEPEPPSRARPAVGEELSRVVMRCLAKEPALRYPDATSIARDLGSYTSRVGGVAPPGQTAAARRRWPLALAVGALVALGSAALVFGRRTPEPLAMRGLSVNVAAPGPTTMLDLPAPAHCNAEALVEYTAGLRSMHLGIWERAHRHFVKAVELDPDCAEASLRLTLCSTGTEERDTLRERYRRTTALKAQLTPRDQKILIVLEPFVMRMPPDERELNARFRSLSDELPGDAEVAGLAALFQRLDPDERERLARRALAIDAQYPDAWEALADARLDRGDRAGAIDAISQGLLVGGSEGLRIRAGIYEQLGDCAKAEADVKTWLLHDPSSSLAYRWFARALAGGGAPPATVRETLAQRWATSGDAERKLLTLEDTLLVDAFEGDFNAAADAAREFERLVDGLPDLEAHARHAVPWVGLLVETGRAAEAVAFAEAFAQRSAVWTRRPLGYVVIIEEPVVHYAEPALVGVRRRFGSLSNRDAERALAPWRAWAASASSPATLWAYGSAGPATSAEDAAEAIGTMPTTDAGRGKVNQNLATGRALLLAGDAARAVPFLRQASGACVGYAQVFEQMQAHLVLGDALAKTGDVSGACSAYARVIARWGKARPTSVTAKQARMASGKLPCPP